MCAAYLLFFLLTRSWISSLSVYLFFEIPDMILYKNLLGFFTIFMSHLTSVFMIVAMSSPRVSIV